MDVGKTEATLENQSYLGFAATDNLLCTGFKFIVDKVDGRYLVGILIRNRNFGN